MTSWALVLLYLIAMLVPSLCYARPCLEMLPELEAGYSGSADWERSQCEVVHGNANLVLLAIPLFDQRHEVVDLEVGVFDKNRRKIVARRVERGLLVSDAIYVNGITLDRARYVLNSDQRAFGVRVRWRGSSTANPLEYETISLYMQTGSTLDRPLSDMRTETASGEWDTLCDGTFSTVLRTISVAPKSGGWADLVVREVTVDEAHEQGKSGCTRVRSERSIKHYKLIHNGTGYVVPEELSQD